MKKKILILVLAVTLLLAGCSAKIDTITNLSDVKLASGQTLVTGEVTSIAGNTVTLTVGTLNTKQQSSEAGPMASGVGTKSGSAATTGNNSSGQNASGSYASASGSLSNNLDVGSGSGDSYVSGASYAGTRLSSTTNVTVTDTSGNAVKNSGTGGFGFENRGGAMAEGGSSSATAANTTTGSSLSQIKLTDETMNLTIPVGTKVLMTSNGILTTTTFGRIQESDIIQIILQTDSGGNKTVIEAQIMG
jgi:hypothetical protein